MFCQECGKEVIGNYCSNCGKAQNVDNKKFCKFCGGQIPMEAVVCTLCGRQVEELKRQEGPQVVINNSNNNVNTNNNANAYVGARVKNKWVSLLLCIFLGWLGAHKFYEGKILLGILYLFTFGLFGIGVLIDFFVILFKPNPYCV